MSGWDDMLLSLPWHWMFWADLNAALVSCTGCLSTRCGHRSGVSMPQCQTLMRGAVLDMFTVNMSGSVRCCAISFGLERTNSLCCYERQRLWQTETFFSELSRKPCACFHLCSRQSLVLCGSYISSSWRSCEFVLERKLAHYESHLRQFSWGITPGVIMQAGLPLQLPLCCASTNG